MLYAEVALNRPIHSTYTYHIPDELLGKIAPGHLVRVAFGTAKQPAIVVQLRPYSPVEKTKPIEARLDPEPVLTEEQIQIAMWISDTTLAPLGMCLWLFLPAGLVGHSDLLLSLVKSDLDLQDESLSLNPLEAQIAALLKRRKRVRLRQMRQTIQNDKLDKAVRDLTQRGIIHAEPVLSPPATRPQTIQTAALAIHPAAIPDVMRYLGKKSVRADLLEAVADLTTNGYETPVQHVLTAAGSTRATLKKLADEDELIEFDEDGEFVNLTLPHEEVDEAALRLRKGERDLHILKVLSREFEPVDVSWVYAQTGAKLADLKRLADLDLILLGEKETWRDSLTLRDFVPAAAPALTPGQQRVWEKITPSLAIEREEKLPRNFLLHGVTGSGKTEIYLRAIDTVIAQGRQAIFLVPEIALTAQTVRRVVARFPGKVCLVHSRLSAGELYDTWRRCREGLVQIVVGTRSALFAPLPDVGLVCIDEEHDDSFKNFSTPHYDARTVAEWMMNNNGGVVILGSATPDLETFHRAHDRESDLTYLHLPDRIMGHRQRIKAQTERERLTTRYQAEPYTGDDALTIELPAVQVVDMREELKEGNTSIFSRALHEALTHTLAHGEQAILLLNRRGAATYVFCRDCGFVVHCPRCDMPLTHHQHSATLKCHHCGYEEKTPTTCPNCKSRRIKFFGAGTQQVEEELNHRFPKARIVRWDSDTARRPEMHDAILLRFLNHEADVMVGTQLVAKGLDLPRVTLVGVISADVGLNLPDFRAGERTFQLLTQVAGRAGRGLLGGQVILQTYQPDHYAVNAASQHDYAGFYTQELEYRRELGYPPFRRLARLLFSDAQEIKARDAAMHAAAQLQKLIEDKHMTATELIGPAPCFFHRLNDQYRWHILIRSPDPNALMAGVDTAALGWHVELDPVDLL
jgi:primosomal protein N' (replication factor Y)